MKDAQKDKPKDAQKRLKARRGEMLGSMSKRITSHTHTVLPTTQ